jgi:hypothetical protein
MGAVTRLCQTMALATGLPLTRSHSTVVSRWFVTPMAAMSAAESPAFARASLATCSCDDQIASGSCSTCPGAGKICSNSCCATDTTAPSWRKTMARDEVVPWSRARMKRLMMRPRSPNRPTCGPAVA